ncbi:hypothetical protein LCGC14_0740280 [marine sediment metagenome]|uniref:Uncharacterized protein n=1 Tax=marine sediment metagenome TaxID=412755 RepID=A0A0F9QB62_9ZZZZ
MEYGGVRAEVHPTDRYFILAQKFLASNQSDVDWKIISREVGFDRTPQRDSKAVLEAMAKARMLEDTPIDLGDDGKPSLDEDQIRLNMLLSQEDDPNWLDLAKLARRVLAKIGSGLISSGAGQVAALKEVIARAEGRVGADAESEENVEHILILPVQDTEDGPTVIVPKELKVKT